MNGAVWSASREWPLAHKMRTDFSDAVLAQLATTDGELRVSGTHGHVQGVISVADSSYSGISAGFNGISAGNESVADALTAAQVQTSHALQNSARSTGAFLKKAGRFVRRKPATTD